MTSDWDELERAIAATAKEAFDEVYEDLAQQIASDLKSRGLSSATGVDLPLETGDPNAVIDEARVRRRVNEILAGN